MTDPATRAVLHLSPPPEDERSSAVDFDTADPDARTLRQAFGCFPSGVTAVGGLVGGEPVGMAVSSFTSVSLTPPLLSVCIRASSSTWPRLRDRRRLGLSVLAEDQDAACRRLADRDRNRFAGVRWRATPEGAVFLDGASAWFECSLAAELPGGDHTIALLRIHRVRTDPATPPLVFHGSRFRRLAPDDQQ
ncbi:flavin reductase family protein [Streptomyces sp. NPDC006385]|uniref:flavin reductase family protein n=1 Tax=Streptomyces sp. NPDC006385 TaxID=3156761 RepID=UPI0033B79265